MMLKNTTKTYTDQNSVVFKITEVNLKNDDVWVSYINESTGQEYNCRYEAFTHRFTELVQ